MGNRFEAGLSERDAVVVEVDDVGPVFVAEVLLPPEQLAELTRAQYKLWGDVVKANNIRAD